MRVVALHTPTRISPLYVAPGRLHDLALWGKMCPDTSRALERSSNMGRQRFEVRKTPQLVKHVNAIMRHHGFCTFAEMFRTLIRQAYKCLPDKAK